MADPESRSEPAHLVITWATVLVLQALLNTIGLWHLPPLVSVLWPWMVFFYAAFRANTAFGVLKAACAGAVLGEVVGYALAVPAPLLLITYLEDRYDGQLTLFLRLFTAVLVLAGWRSDPSGERRIRRLPGIEVAAFTFLFATVALSSVVPRVVVARSHAFVHAVPLAREQLGAGYERYKFFARRIDATPVGDGRRYDAALVGWSQRGWGGDLVDVHVTWTESIPLGPPE